MPQVSGYGSKSLPPALVAFLMAALVCAFLLLSLDGVNVYREVSRQEALLAAHGEADLYLVPVECGNEARGEAGRDYLPGEAHRRNRSIKLCLYSPSAYDRLFPARYPETGYAAHVAQARETGVDLVVPSAPGIVLPVLAVIAAVGILLAIPRIYGSSRTVSGWRGHRYS